MLLYWWRKVVVANDQFLVCHFLQVVYILYSTIYYPNLVFAVENTQSFVPNSREQYLCEGMLDDQTPALFQYAMTAGL